MKKFKPSQVALLVSALCAAPALWAQTATTDLGKISVQGTPGTGLITQEETPKARSSVTKAHIESLTPSASPYQVIEMLPGVNTYSYDATGLFGGSLTIRGANSDQMGFTINGAPVNDSGNFAVYPQEYADNENMCEVFVTQGSTDNEAPHVGASGGNVGMQTCAPTDKFGITVAQTVGDLNHFKTFVRVNTGKFANDTAKLFISYSKAKSDKFKGPGVADKDHVDFGAEWKPTNSLSFSTSFLYNKAVNNNLLSLSTAQINQYGMMRDFSATFPTHLPGGAGAQNEASRNPTNFPDNYYGFQVNPFLNYLWTAKAEFKASKDLSFGVEPYFWYGFGNGGTSLVNLAESTAAVTNKPTGGGRLGGGLQDINGDGDTLDTIMAYRASVTRTFRPGVTLKTNVRFGDHNVMAGYWMEKARHFQTQPAVRFNNSGKADDIWFENPDLFIRHLDGTYYQGRDQMTISTATSAFLQDTFNAMNDRMNVQVAVRQSEINRDYYNYANDNSGNVNGSNVDNTFGAADYRVNKTYSKLLPSIGIRYALSAESSVFGNLTDNMKAPGNFSYQTLLTGTSGTVANPAFVNGVLKPGYTFRDPRVEAETSTNLDLGYRYAGDAATFSGTVFYNSFRNRIASSYDPVAGFSTDYNVGGVTTQGFELESGYKFSAAWSAYGSLSFTRSVMADNLQTSATVIAQTSGKLLPAAPEQMASLRVNYKTDTWYGNIDMKYTGKTYSTLVNDEWVDASTVFGLTAGYKFGDDAGTLKKASVQLNVSNLFNTNYLRLSGSSGSQFKVNAAGAPLYYVGAPRFVSVTLRKEF